MVHMLRSSLAFFGFLCLATTASAASLDGIAVDVTNTSEPVLCAEKDNVTINFASPTVRNFRIEAAHPTYVGMLRDDKWEPDWTACGALTAESSAAPPVHKVTFYESVDLWLTGFTFPNFWRQSEVTMRVGDRVESNLHLIQLWVRKDDRAEEVLVLYPTDGYWRIRPLPPAHLGWSAYGSSFMLGPVEVNGRPMVRLKDVVFDPKAMTFTVTFAKGGKATIAIRNLDRDRITLDVNFDRPVESGSFAALRSMYVTEFNADVARIAAREEGAPAWTEGPIMKFRDTKATDVWMGRLVPSRHNTSAPDMMFNRFSDGNKTVP
ncbi:hypothetical protein [Microvirga brassicacearum]|uniref:Uncharacterized protein n=1 Tax=Microvirga brassicacearum TaxID=2580413 RepID=A0A5N3PC86_9HYPH|nr:hypothetical protein [Microvirga brassicacearum]KAB0267352.1 hypothetical protein FEZ63_08530 [Microvirga brassicacearum]